MQNTTKRLSNNINFLAIKPNTIHSLEHQNIPSNQTMIQFFSTIPVQLPYTLSKEKLTKRNASRVAKEKKKKKETRESPQFLTWLHSLDYEFLSLVGRNRRRIYIYIYASPSQSPFPRLKHDIPYQRRDHSQDWQVRCRIGRHEEKAEWSGVG